MRFPKAYVLTLGALVLAALAPPVDARPLMRAPESEISQGILTFEDAPPTGAELAALRAVGLEAQGFEQLPMAIVRGTPAQIGSAVAGGVAVKFYPDEPLTYVWTESNHTIGVGSMHELGFTGKGIQVAVVDTGIDATHPDLADHVVHNVRMVGPEYAGQPSGSPPGSIVVPFDEGPYSNTDVSGHGTLVAGVLAADGTTDASQVGVAPDADLIGYSVGIASNFMTTAIAAYDHILATPKWGIDVVNNSWATPTFATYDPDHPINVATRALTDSGIAMVWAAGNGGDGEAEMTLNPYAQAPWNISVAGSDVFGRRWTGSSNGLMVDNSEPTAPTEGHLRFTGDRIGMYHPTSTAPGAGIETSCAPANLYSLCVPGETGTVDGTSVAAPHVSGLAALLRQARPALSVTRLRAALEATARPTAGDAPVWQVGYGLVDGAAALELVLKRNFEHHLVKAHQMAEARVLAARDWKVPVSELWVWEHPPVTAGGITDSRELTFPVPFGTDAVKVAIAYYSNAGATDYGITVRDADGQEVGLTTPSTFAGVSTVLIDLRDTAPAFGDWTLQVDGRLALVNDTLENGRVTVQAALLEAQEAVVPRFVADGVMPLAFTPDPERTTGLMSPEGCDIEPGAPVGTLAELGDGIRCHSGQSGWAMSYNVAPAEFTSEALERSLVLGGEVSIVVHLSDPTRPIGSAIGGRLEYELDEISADGSVDPVGSGTAITGGTDGRNVGSFQITPSEVAAGSRLRLRLIYPGAYSSGARMIFGGEDYGDAGITLTVGHIETRSAK